MKLSLHHKVLRVAREPNSQTMIFSPTKVVLVLCWALFLALFCWVAATDSNITHPNPKIKPHGGAKDFGENSGAFQKKFEKNGWGPEAKEELMGADPAASNIIQSKVGQDLQKKIEKEGQVPKGDTNHSRVKRSGPLSWSKYLTRKF